MKKYAILTSVLALAACGGGSGSGGGTIIGGDTDIKPITSNGPKVSDITGMNTSVVDKSAVVKSVEDKLGDLEQYAATPKSRAAKSGMTLAQKYELAMQLIEKAKETLNDLTSVTEENKNDVIEALKLAGQNVSDDTSINNIKENLGDIKETIDSIISGATQTLNDVEFNIVSANDDGEMENGVLKIKTDGKTISNIMLSYSDDPDDKFTLTPIEGNKFKSIVTGGDTDEVFESEIVMLGKQHKLQYADFGYVENTLIEGGESEVSREYLTGGYDAMRMSKEELSGKMTFSGAAVAQMWDDATTDYNYMQDDNATLTFDNGDETLNMQFKDWYTVTLSNNSIKFEGTAAKQQFALKTAENPDNSKVMLNTNYYGDGTAEEATANFGYVEGQYKGNGNTDLKAFTGAFGGKITK